MYKLQRQDFSKLENLINRLSISFFYFPLSLPLYLFFFPVRIKLKFRTENLIEKLLIATMISVLLASTGKKTTKLSVTNQEVYTAQKLSQNDTL